MTWIDLLGRDTDYVHVEGCDIVRGFEQMERLWTFDTPEQAEENFDAWLREVIREKEVKITAPIGTWASVASLWLKRLPLTAILISGTVGRTK